jgi:hypothetical protein
MDRVRGDAAVGKTLTLDKARRIAANVAKLPGYCNIFQPE